MRNGLAESKRFTDGRRSRQINATFGHPGRRLVFGACSSARRDARTAGRWPSLLATTSARRPLDAVFVRRFRRSSRRDALVDPTDRRRVTRMWPPSEAIAIIVYSVRCSRKCIRYYIISSMQSARNVRAKLRAAK